MKETVTNIIVVASPLEAANSNRRICSGSAIRTMTKQLSDLALVPSRLFVATRKSSVLSNKCYSFPVVGKKDHQEV